MEQKIAIKIEGPTEDKLPIFFVFFLLLALLFVSLTLALLVVELLQIDLPKSLLLPILPF
jgi:hypothetical protein